MFLKDTIRKSIKEKKIPRRQCRNHSGSRRHNRLGHRCNSECCKFNTSGRGGVDGAIHREGGPKILEECKRIRATEWPEGLPTGEAAITSGGNLKAKHVVHVVGPIWRGGTYEEPRLLAQAYWNSLQLTVSKGLRTIDFPSISTGAYGYPIEKASEIAVATVREFLTKEDQLKKVVFVLFTEHDLGAYVRKVKELLIKD